MALPADRHVHSEWSWDAANGSMERTCETAIALGLPAVAFTEHVDHDAWPVDAKVMEGCDHLLPFYTDGLLTPGRFDVQGYMENVERCRDLFPSLIVLSGVELGEPHWRPEATSELLSSATFDCVLGSVHGIMSGGSFEEAAQMYATRKPGEVVKDYLTEVRALILGSQDFTILAHIDYALRYWDMRVPDQAFSPSDFEEEFREVLTLLAESERALELNSRHFYSDIVGWWRDCGGRLLSFGSDAHNPTAVGARFQEAAELAEAQGFRPGAHPFDLWRV